MTAVRGDGWIGQGAARAAMLDAWRSGRMHHGWLLTGAAGMGKAGFASDVARFLLTRHVGAGCDAASLDDPGDPVPDRLLSAGNHPEYLVTTRLLKEKPGGKGVTLARNITIDQVRAINAKMHGTIALGAWRVVVIDAADDLEPAAANALLKTLEEPPAATVFLLISHQPGRLLPTIRSRCRTLHFPPLAADVMAAWLHRQRPLLEAAQRDAIVLAARGIPAKALQYLDSRLPDIEARLTAIARSGDPDGQARAELGRDMAKAAARDDYALLLDRAPSLFAELVRAAPPLAQQAGLAQWQRLTLLAGDAIRGSYDPAPVGFEIGTCFAALAVSPDRRSG